MIWAEAVKKAGSFDRDAVMAAVAQNIEWTGPGGKMVIDGKTHSTQQDVHIIQVKDRSGACSRPRQIPPYDFDGRCNLPRIRQHVDILNPQSLNESTAEATDGSDHRSPDRHRNSVALLTLISLGLAIIFGMMRVINFAHGEFIMLGGYATVLSANHGVNIWIAMLVVAPRDGRADRRSSSNV